MATGAGTYSFPNGLPTVELPAGTDIIRIHRLVDSPIWFGPRPGAPPAYRFDSPTGEYRMLYAAKTLTGAFVETILRLNRRIVAAAFIDDRQWTVLRIGRPVLLAKLHGDGLLNQGIDSSISSAPLYAAPQRFALALFRTFKKLDGLIYRSRHNDDEICYAMFDRVAPSDLTAVSSQLFDDNRQIADGIMAAHGAAWDTSPPT